MMLKYYNQFREKFPRLAVAAPIALVAIMMAPAAMRLFASIPVAQAGDIRREMQSPAGVGNDKLKRGASLLQNALTFDGANAQLADDIGLFRLQEVVQRRQAGETLDENELEESIAYFKLAIARAPMRTHVWLRYAYALYLRDGYTQSVDDALLMSHNIGPAEGDDLAFRLQLGLSNWDLLSTEMRDATRRQARLLWRYPPQYRDQLLDLYLQLTAPETMDVVRDAALAEGALEENFLYEVRRRRAENAKPATSEG